MVIRILILLIFVPVPLVFGKVAAQGVNRIMNDVWYDSLMHLKINTAEDAIINSWWPPGYFINAVAQRRTVIDGGTQQNPQTYWTARALLTSDERIAVGILRMMNTHGNQALEFLLANHWEISEAIQVIIDTIRTDDGNLKYHLSSKMTKEEIKKFLHLVKGNTASPAYLFLYNDLIEQNLALTLLAKWNFKKAKEFQEQASKSNKPIILKAIDVLRHRKAALMPWFPILDGTKLMVQVKHIKGIGLPDMGKIYLTVLSGNAITHAIIHRMTDYETVSKNKFQSYLDEVFATIEGAWQYLPESGITSQNQNLIKFGNGVILDFVTQTVRIETPDGSRRVMPHSVFEVIDQRLVEHVYPGSKIPLSVLIFQNEGKMQTVIADPALIRSVLFQMYYLDGVTLTHFNLFDKRNDKKTNIKTFKIL